MTERTKFEYGAIDGASLLTVEHDDSGRNVRKIVKTASARLYHLASHIPTDRVIGWQIDVPELTCHVFSSSDACVSSEDFNWAFGSSASVASEETEHLSGLFEGGRRVYVLSSAADDTYRAPDDDTDSDSMFDDFFETEALTAETYREMLAMMKDAGAVIRVCMGERAARAFGIGKVYISLPEEMTLRMKSMLSIIFPRTGAAEVSANQDGSDRYFLPDEIFMENVNKLLTAVILTPEETASGEEGKGGRGDASADEMNGDMFASLESLNLSVRAYNCLRRAGIDSIEKLVVMTEDDLLRVRNLGRKATGEVLEIIAKYKKLYKPAAPIETENYTAMLDELIGLREVKDQIGKIAAFARMNKKLAESGSVKIPMTLNMEFVGNPGTAKTTVARIAAGILYEIGLISSSKMIEVGRSDLVAGYVGQTATRVKEIFQRAKGKLLFIDEAYSLLDDRKGEFGDEAINTIVQEMENNRDTVVIFAGYPDRMKEFFERNPGLRSRVPFSIRFEDYSAEDMVSIAKLEAKKRGFSISEGADRKVMRLCSDAVRDPGTGNGRFCRNLIENAILGFASRVFGADGGASFSAFVLESEDFDSPSGGKGAAEEKRRIGFSA